MTCGLAVWLYSKPWDTCVCERGHSDWPGSHNLYVLLFRSSFAPGRPPPRHPIVLDYLVLVFDYFGHDVTRARYFRIFTLRLL